MKTNITRTLVLSSHLSEESYQLARQCSGIQSQDDVKRVAKKNDLSLAELYAFLDHCGDILDHDPRVVAFQKGGAPLIKVR